MDDDLMTDEMRQQYAQLGNENTSVIHLHNQRDDPIIDAMIKFLIGADMSTDKNWHNVFHGKRKTSLIVLTNYYILQELQTSLRKILPRVQQMVILKHFRLTIMKEFNEISHLGFKNCNLSLEF